MKQFACLEDALKPNPLLGMQYMYTISPNMIVEIAEASTMTHVEHHKPNACHLKSPSITIGHEET